MAKHPGRVVNGKRVASKIWPRTCPHCRKDFLGTGKQIFCGRDCKEAADLVAREAIKCEWCGKPIAARKGQRFCSPTCKIEEKRATRKKRVGKPDLCRHCGEAYIVEAASQRHCSPECKTCAASQKKYLARHPIIDFLKVEESIHERPDHDPE